MDTSELTSKQPISKQEKEGTPTLKKRGKTKPKTKLSIVLNNSKTKHVQGPSTATCIVLTTYHNISTIFISSWHWVEVNILDNRQLLAIMLGTVASKPNRARHPSNPA
jgi:hypothetical protein